MIKVDIVSGFLGAGKTTFIKELISKIYKDEKLVLIENEFGEIGIDSRFMQGFGIEVTEMNSGCICCTLVGDFARALKQVAEELSPDRIIIEPSGVGKLSDVAKAVMDVRKDADVEIEHMITVADGVKAGMYMKNFGEFFNDQIEHAGTIVISRSQKLDENKLSECVKLLRSKNAEAAIVTTPWNLLSEDMIKSALSGGKGLEKQLQNLREDIKSHHVHEHQHHGHDHEHVHGPHHGHGGDNAPKPHHGHHDEDAPKSPHGHHEHTHTHEHAHEAHHGHHEHHEHCECGHDHHADEIFDSWGVETVHKFSRNELEDILKLMGTTDNFGNVLRAKGIVSGEDEGWMEFDMVPEEVQIRPCRPDYIGRICVIGTELYTEELKRIFSK